MKLRPGKRPPIAPADVKVLPRYRVGDRVLALCPLERFHGSGTEFGYLLAEILYVYPNDRYSVLHLAGDYKGKDSMLNSNAIQPLPTGNAKFELLWDLANDD